MQHMYVHLLILQIQLYNGFKEIFLLLIENGADKNCALRCTIREREKELSEMLIDAGAYVKPYGKIHLKMYKLGWKELYSKIVWNRRKHLINIYYE